MAETKSVQVMIRLTPETREALRKRAAEDRRTVSDYLRLLIERDVTGARGNGKAEPAN